jgi:hypothetical protein
MKKVNWSAVTKRAIENHGRPSDDIEFDVPKQSVDMKAVLLQVENFMGTYSRQFEVEFEGLEGSVQRAFEKQLQLLRDATPTRIEVKTPDNKLQDVGLCHYNFSKLVRMLGAHLNVALIGEAGSGKTHGAEQSATALGLKSYIVSFHAKMTATDLRGYCDAVGNYNPSPLYTALKEGGVLILDEFDRANTEVVVSLNNLLAGSSYLFPNGERVAKHKDFLVVACQNTTGTGNSKQYASASRQDGSTLNRFVKLEWHTDETLERSIAGDNEATRSVQAIRRKARELGMDLIISPRQSIDANKMMAVGFTLDEALQHTIFECLAPDQVKRLRECL